MKVKTLRQCEHFHTTASEFYDLMMISKKHAAFSGAPAKISTKVGGNFSVYDGYAEGTHLELFKGRKIKQTWRASDWPAKHFSTVTFTFRKPDEGGCTVDFIQEGIPQGQFNAISEGWSEFYWEPIRAFLARKKDEEDRN